MAVFEVLARVRIKYGVGPVVDHGGWEASAGSGEGRYNKRRQARFVRASAAGHGWRR